MAVGFSLAAATGFGPSALGGVASGLAADYGVSLAAIGVATAALLVTHVLVQIPAGAMSDRVGARTTGALGLLLIATGSLVAILEPSFGLLVVGRLIAGAGTGLCFIAGIGHLRECGIGALGQGLYGGIALASGGVALVTVPLLYSAFEWRAPLVASLVIVATGLALIAVEWHAERDAPEWSKSGPIAETSRKTGALIRDPGLWAIAALYAAAYGLSFIIAIWTTELVVRETEAGRTAASAIAATVLALSVVSRPFGGWLLARFPLRIRSIVQASLVAGGLGTLAIALAGGAPLAALGAVVVGVAGGIPFAAAFAGAALTRRDAPGEAAGMVNAVANAVALIGTPLVGLTFSAAGSGRVGLLVVGALWFAALAVVPRPLGLGVPRAGLAESAPR